MTENEFILEDRIAKIQAINKQINLLENGYISFSGGKDSCVLSKLIDLALPNNQIPRVYGNTGIEYIDMVKFVKEQQKTDLRIVIVNQTQKIKPTLEKYGYPFKSKEHSLRVYQFNKNNNNKNYILKYITGIDKGKPTKFKCPKILLYQFEERGKYNYSNQCCYKLKKNLLHKWQREHNKQITITGMRNAEGGNRARLSCLTDNGYKFHPLVVVTEEWENWFIKQYNIELCKLYYPPFNFKRTGCVGCPFAIDINHELEQLKKLLPIEYNRAVSLWKPVYDEYVRLGYRLPKDFYTKSIQYNIEDYIGDKNEN